MNKSQRFLRSIVSVTAVFVVFSFVFLASGVYAASTIGTNMSTTGTFAQTVGSASAALFQNAAGTVTTLSVDTTNVRVGVGAAASTTFEVQGTASASYFFTTNTLQAGGTFAAASVAYSRFGVDTTGHSLAAADDLLVSGLVEFNDNAFFDSKVSISGNFETTGRIRAGTASHSFTGDLFVTKNLIVGSATASSSGGAYVAEFSKAGTASMYFGSSDATLGSCLQLTDTAGNPVYARVVVGGTSFTISTVSCR